MTAFSKNSMDAGLPEDPGQFSMEPELGTRSQKPFKTSCSYTRNQCFLNSWDSSIIYMTFEENQNCISTKISLCKSNTLIYYYNNAFSNLFPKKYMKFLVHHKLSLWKLEGTKKFENFSSHWYYLLWLREAEIKLKYLLLVRPR